MTPDRRVLASHETLDGGRCVDVFLRPDGSFGFEEYRRDPEDGGRWSAAGSFGALRYPSAEVATAAARRAVPWFGGV